MENEILQDIIDQIGEDEISEVIFGKSSVKFKYEDSVFTIKTLAGGDVISIEVQENDTLKDLGFIRLSVFNYHQQLNEVVNIISNH